MSSCNEYCSGGFRPDDVVISGISGRFPQCCNVGELQRALYDKRRLVGECDERWPKGSFGLGSTECGFVKDLSKFDAEFFGIPTGVVNTLDPGVRKLLEVCYEAMVDSGYDPHQLRGEDIGVYCAVCRSETTLLEANSQSTANLSDFGRMHFMHANRCSFAFDFHGPSFAADSACSSSGAALWSAFHDLREGRASAALVCGVQILLHPRVTAGYVQTGIVKAEGKSIPFDAETEGTLRSEAVCAVFLQKAADARRAYATVVNVRQSSAGYVPEGLYSSSFKEEVRLFRTNLEESGVDPEEVNFVEAHGTGTPVGDTTELNAIAEVFCKNREKPLLVGTVKSNIGHTEAASGLCGLIKAILAFETGLIPPNWGYNTPTSGCPALVRGDIRVVKESTPLAGRYVACNAFGLGGTNVQVLLKRNPVGSTERETERGLPRLVLAAGSIQEGVSGVFDYVEGSLPDLQDGFFALLDHLPYSPGLQKPYRGYALFGNGQELARDVKLSLSGKPEVWFILTGMGCQWAGMGLGLMKIDFFAQSIRRSASILEPYGLDLMAILKSENGEMNTDRRILPAFVAICAIQIALLDVLSALGIHPDGLIGHSTGEIACAYADKCFTAEQALLAAYWRGRCVEEANIPRGAMAAVGLKWDETKSLCPDGVFPACHNAVDSVTVSGLEEQVGCFVSDMKSGKVFAKVVDVYGFPFHSPLLGPVAKPLATATRKVVPDPKPRSSRWISTCYPEPEWETPGCRTAGADYFVQNMCHPVLFAEALRKVPIGAVVVEVGPHGLLQSVVKRALGTHIECVAPMRRNTDNVILLLETVGRLYTLGLDPQVDRLYPPAKFPVPRGTPRISDLVRWDHSSTWPVARWTPGNEDVAQRQFNLHGTDAYLLDHAVAGRALFPATGYAYLAWEALAQRAHGGLEDTPVVLESLEIHRAVVLDQSGSVSFKTSILNATGRFEITEGNSLVASGSIRSPKKLELSPEPSYTDFGSDDVLSGRDVYDELNIRGYRYGPAFRNILESSVDGSRGLILWNDKWIPYLDSVLLFCGLRLNSEALVLPTAIRSIKIDAAALERALDQHPSLLDGKTGLPVSYNRNLHQCRAPGVEITKVEMTLGPDRTTTGRRTVMEVYRFAPYVGLCPVDQAHQERCTTYRAACMDIAEQVRGVLYESTNTPEVEYALETTDNCVLLKALKGMLHLGAAKKREIFQKYINSMGEDVLTNSLTHEYALRTVLDITRENNTRKLNMLEIHHKFTPLAPLILDISKRYNQQRNISIRIVSSNIDALDTEAMDSLQIKLMNAEALAEEKEQDVVFGSFLFGTPDQLQSQIQTIATVVKPGGFVVLMCRVKAQQVETFLASACEADFPIRSEMEIEKAIQDGGLFVVSKLYNEFGCCLYLLRRPTDAICGRRIIRIETGNFKWVEDLKSALRQRSDVLWLVSEDSTDTGLIGMVNCLLKEPGGDKIRCVYTCGGKLPRFEFEDPFYRSLLQRDIAMNVYVKGSWGTFRHFTISNEIPTREVGHSYVAVMKPGDLSSMQWKESGISYGGYMEERMCHVYYSALNFKDVLEATRKIPVLEQKSDDGSHPLGFEFSGRDAKGRRIFGTVPSHGIATEIIVDPLTCYPVPDQWSLAEAATVPVIYGTCYYALVIRARLQKGESILIHSGAGGIGQAAIRIATSLACEVFTTVGNEEKRKYIGKEFPDIRDENIGCSRDVTFEAMVMERTRGRGVDVVVNSLAEDKFLASVRCVAKHGRFVELGRFDLVKNHELDGLRTSTETLKEIGELLMEGIRRGVVVPLRRTVFPRHEVEQAFRYMSSGRHIGKVLIEMRDEETEPECVPRPLRIPAIPATYFHPRKVYVVVGGLGGFGLELAKWLVRKGARRLVLTSRRGPSSAHHRLCLARWADEGVRVDVSTRNVAVEREARALLEEATRDGLPLGGIFNAAVVLSDAFLENQSAAGFESVCAPKADATRHLDALLTGCPGPDYFVCFSTIVSGRGNAGQANYAYANSVMERVCERRRSAGLHALAIQWGYVGQVGVAHRSMGDEGVVSGTVAQDVASCLATLDAFCRMEGVAVPSSYALAEKMLVPRGVLARVAKIFGLTDPSEFNAHRTLAEMGMDSLMGVELQHLLHSRCNVDLSLGELQDLRVADIEQLAERAENSEQCAA